MRTSASMRMFSMLVLTLLVFNACAFSQSSFFKKRTADYGLAVGVWLPGTISTNDFEIDKNAGFLLHGFADFYLMEKLAMGVYANYAPVSVEASDETATLYEFGVSIKPRFLLGEGAVAIKPGLELGYRGISLPVDNLDAIRAFAVNLSVEVQFRTSAGIVPFGLVGFLAQPMGGNKDVDVTFAPIFLLGGGIAF